MVKKCDYCGVISGREHDKFQECGFTKNYVLDFPVPGILESPVNILCKLKQIIELGSHDMFLADVVGLNVDDKYLDQNNKLDLAKARLVTYSHGEYYSLGEKLGTFGYSVRKKNE